MSNYPAAAEPEPEDDDDDDPTVYRGHKGQLAFHGNERTMNIVRRMSLLLEYDINNFSSPQNPLILTNVQGSPYFKVVLIFILSCFKL